MTAITPPTMMATIGTSNPPNPKKRSTKFSNARSSAYEKFSGGADRDRTGGLLVANQALSQLSYSPNAKFQSCKGFRVSMLQLETLKRWHLETLILVGLDRLELSTSPLSGVRSSHLSYRPGFASTLRSLAAFIGSWFLATTF